MEGEGDDTSQKLHNMMRISDELSYDYSFAAAYISKAGITNRTSAVNWMKHCVEHVLGADCPTTRDTSIQIFDKFLLFSSSEDPEILKNTDFISYSAAASVVLGAKITDTNSQLTLTKFSESDFDVDYLVQFEQHVLAVTCCQISPLCTPTNFLHQMMELMGNIERKDTVLKNADLLIAEFWGEPVSLLYAPSTIALTALLLSFSLAKIPCGSLLSALPLCCFLSPANPFFECSTTSRTCEVEVPVSEQEDTEGEVPVSLNARFLDHERCIAEFQQMEVMRSYQRSCTPMPASSAACKDLDAPAAANQEDGEESCCPSSGLGASPVSVAARQESPSRRSSRRASSPRPTSAAPVAIAEAVSLQQEVAEESPGKRLRRV